MIVLTIGIAGGFFGAYSSYYSKFIEYDRRIYLLKLEVVELNSTIINLKAEFFNALDQISVDQSLIEDLKSRITYLLAHVDIFYGNVSVDQARKLISSNISLVILDVRTPSEYESGHIKGAKNIHVDELETRIVELDRDIETLVYCRLGVRSTRAMRILNYHNFTKVYNMLGGIEAWKQAGYSTVP
jgi:rhodanese-related sulfurtransferase